MPEASPGRPLLRSQGVTPRPSRHRRLVVLVPLAVSAGIVLLLGPDLLFRPDIPAVTDLPGHLLPPAFMANELLPHLKLRGWSMDWFAGFPVYHFYFPLPGLVTALLTSWFGAPLALRLTMAAPLVAFPWALHAFARCSRMDTARTVGVVVGGSGLLLMGSYSVLGGNIRSTLSGQYYYGWSLALVVLYLGLVARGSAGSDRGRLAGVLLAAAVLSHVLPALAAGLGTAPLLLSTRHRRAVLESWVVAGLLSAFWTVPMALRLDQVGDVGWAYAPGPGDILPLEVLLLLPAAATGGVLAWRSPALALLASTGAVGLLVAALPQSLVMRGRMLPLWFLALHVLAGAGLAWAWVATRRGRWRSGLPVLLVAGGAAVVMATGRGTEPSVEGSEAVLRGLPGVPGHSELDALVAHLRTRSPGRLHWEPGVGLGRWGHHTMLSLLPFWTDHTALSGLWRESSGLHPFIRLLDDQLSRAERGGPYATESSGVAWDPARALEKARMLGVRYLITHTEETGDTVEALTRHSPERFGALRLFDLGEVSLVSVAVCVAPVAGAVAFRPAAEAWFSHWTRGEPLLVRGDTPGARPSADCPQDGGVRDLDVEHEHIRFRTDHPGVPHLVRVAYFPNWRAEGARGPYLASPWFMLVVPEREVVDLRFEPTAVEWTGWLLTATGILALLASLLRPGRTPARAPGSDAELPS